MRIKTSVSLSPDILDHVSRYVPEGGRSDFIEKALWKYLDFLRHQERDQLDLQKINESSGFLNEEAGDVLTYQAQF